MEIGELSLFNLIPLPKSKSQILTGDIYKNKKVYYLAHIYSYSMLKVQFLFAVNKPCLRFHKEYFLVSGRDVPFLKEMEKVITQH